MMRRLLTYGLMLCCMSGLTLVSLAVGSSRAQAATLMVTNLTDTGTGGCTAVNSGDGCTLREAITAANATPTTPDDIVFASYLAGASSP